MIAEAILACSLALPTSKLQTFKALMSFLVYRHPGSAFMFVEEHEHPRKDEGWKFTELHWEEFRIFERRSA